LARVRLNPVASVAFTDAGVILRSDLGRFQLRGCDVESFVKAAVPLLDGSRDREAVINGLGAYSRQSVLAFLDLLEHHGFLETVEEHENEQWRGQQEYFRRWTGRSEELTHRLREARVLLAGLEPWGVVAAFDLAASGVGALYLLDDGRVMWDDVLSVQGWSSRHVGLRRVDALAEALAETSPWCRVTATALSLKENHHIPLEDARWDLVVGAASGEDLMQLQSLARFAHTRGVPSLFGHLEGLDAVVGPVVVPGETACWNCARLRQLATSKDPEVAHALQDSLLARRLVSRIRTYLAPMAPLLGHLLALEALKILSQYTSSDLIGRLLVQNLVTFETTVHAIIRMPWCEICGGARVGEIPASDLVVSAGMLGIGESTSSKLNKDGKSDELRKSLAGWVDSRTGIIKHLTVVPPETTGVDLPVVSLAVLASYTDGVYVPNDPKICWGKGLTPTEAMMGAVGEALERYSAARYRKADLQRCALTVLEGDFLDPRRLCLYDPAQYDQPDFPFARFDPRRPVEWVRGHWLDTGADVWVPALSTYLDFDVCAEELFCQVTSNGLAAGVGQEDATLRAVLELVERDAFMITWLTQRPSQKLLLDHTVEGAVHGAIQQLSKRGVEVELYLLELGLSLPTVVCLGIGDGEQWPGITVDLAAHISARTAIRKAVLGHTLTGSYIQRLMRSGEHEIPRGPEDVHTPADHALYYVPAKRARVFEFLREGAGPAMPLAEIPEPQDVSLRVCIDLLAARGIRVAVVDVTSPDVATGPFRVVRALGPEMQPIDFGFALRRLANPRLKAMLTGDLNPHPHPLI
jgi:ribosomal protein S12 methylthiotransferase accessory factor